MNKFALAVFCAGLLAAPALADDWLPPPWRNEVSTTLQWWHFGDSRQLDIPPDEPGPLDEGPPYVTGYLPSTKIIEIFPDPTHPEWFETDPLGSARQGIWALSGWIDVIVDNHNHPNDEKWIWVQVTWAKIDPAGTAQPAFVNISPSPSEGPTFVDEYVWCANWQTTVYEWKLDWNPPDELFRLQGDIFVDQLVVDTWCLPEPATLSLLALGAMALIRRRK